MSEFRYTPPSHEIADSLMALAQDIEIGKGRVSVATPPFLREAADRVSRQQAEIERLRAALREISGYTAEPKLYDHEEDMSDRLDSIYKVIEGALGE